MEKEKNEKKFTIICIKAPKCLRGFLKIFKKKEKDIEE